MLMGKTWGHLEKLAQKTDAWMKLVNSHCPTQDPKMVRQGSGGDSRW